MTSSAELMPPRLVARLTEEIRRAPLLLAVEPGAALEDVLRAAWDGPVLLIDLRVSSTEAALAHDLTAAVLDRIALATQIARGAGAMDLEDRLALIAAFADPDAAIATVIHGTPTDGWGLRQATAAVPEDTLLVFQHADALKDRRIAASRPTVKLESVALDVEVVRRPVDVEGPAASSRAARRARSHRA